eukprot:TRINITY_DN5869_c1_g1_i1.p1 TRINITY_DN5869_c1_g1~~TRINITY_DN5869_c1_g1_i1.p1  ORF type:complete len:260 (+),score=25.35 TRINITY_DN5869_c1_g1_i1:288-1067(+)
MGCSTSSTNRTRDDTQQKELMKQKPGHCKEAGKPLLYPKTEDMKEDGYTIILDVDECLLLARGMGGFSRPTIKLRPGLSTLFSTLQTLSADGHEIVLWTSSSETQSGLVWSMIDPTKKVISQIIWRGIKWVKVDPDGLSTDPFSGKKMNSTKDLRLIGRDINKCLLIDNAPQNGVCQPDNCIVVKEYSRVNPQDDTLPHLASLLSSLAESNLSVPEFLKTWPSLHPYDITFTPDLKVRMRRLEVPDDTTILSTKKCSKG